jgi:hypothetical protein
MATVSRISLLRMAHVICPLSFGVYWLAKVPSLGIGARVQAKRRGLLSPFSRGTILGLREALHS